MVTSDREAGRADATCVHHWKLGSPNGRSSVGVCQECGAEREFAASVSAAGWARAPRGIARRPADPPRRARRGGSGRMARGSCAEHAVESLIWPVLDRGGDRGRLVADQARRSIGASA